jgi:hypothetical protein
MPKKKMLPFQGNVSEALMLLAATTAASSNNWFSESSLTSLYDRVFAVVDSSPCYIGPCLGGDRIILEKRKVRSFLLSGDPASFRATPTEDWATYFYECRPLLRRAQLKSASEFAGELAGYLDTTAPNALLYSSLGDLLNPKETNHTLNELDTIARYMLERRSRADLDSMLRACNVDFEALWLAVRSANDVSFAFEMRVGFVKEDLAALAAAATGGIGEGSGSGSGLP